MDDMLTVTYLRVPKWYTISEPSQKFSDEIAVWHTFNFIRYSFAILAWLILA